MSAEGDRSGPAHRPGVPGGAGDGPGMVVDGEVVRDGPGQRLGFDHGFVAGGTVVGLGLAAAIGRVPVNLQSTVFLGKGRSVVGWKRSRPAIFTPTAASVLSWPVAIVISQSVINPVSGSSARWAR